MRRFTEEVRVKGKTVLVEAIEIDGVTITISGGATRIARVKDEWYGERVSDPEKLVRDLRDSKCQVDVLTFVQRIPERTPTYSYFNELVQLAVLPISTFSNWFDVQITKEVRKNIRKAARKGVVCRTVEFDDNLARGITEIYNECPVRQGKPFWHYGKDFGTIKSEASTYLDKSDFIGAYLGDELVGFIKLVYLPQCASTMHVISKIAHRDKAPTNALIARAVEICQDKKLSFLHYGEWTDGSLGDFKRYCGFEKIGVPRYYVPLSTKGAVVIRFNLHHGLRGIVPRGLKERFVNLRRRWYAQQLAGKKE